MITTTATTTATTTWVITADQCSWLADDWAAHYESDEFACSVLDAADSLSGLLPIADLRRLLAEHGATVDDLMADIEAAQRAGCMTPCEQHAGQALAWLGY
jgi:hypothetical protein